MSNVSRLAAKPSQLRLVVSATVLAALLGSGPVSAQMMEQPTQGFAAGDRLIFNWILNNKSQIVEVELSAGTDGEWQGTEKVGGKEFPLALAKSDLALRKSMCISNGQPCTFSPGLEFAKFPLEKGKQWSTTFTVKGDTFTAQVTQERKVEGTEKVKVLAGEFDTFKLSFSGRIRGTDSKGAGFTGKEEGTDWFTLVNGRLVAVKLVYKNSFGEKATRELVSTSFK